MSNVQTTLKDSVMSKINTQLQGFDTVVAITQKAINAQFVGLKRMKVIQDDLNIQLPRRLGTLTAKVLAPTVRIDTGDTRRVVFILNLASGTFSTYNEEGNPVDVSFGKGKIGFRVNVNLDEANLSKLPPSVIQSIKNLGPGMFSMRQLFMDLQNANLAEYDPAETDLPGELTSDPLFMAGLAKYFKQLHENGANILGYAVKVTNPNDVSPECPSFPPTDLNFATHIYAEDGTNQRNPDLDTLNYLLMTEHRNFPANVLPMGNFVEIPGVDGTMAIAKSIFVDRFLLPRLAAITNMTTTFQEAGKRSIKLQTSRNGAFTPTNEGWTFSSSNDITLASHEGAGNTFPSDLYWKMAHSCNLTITPGSNVIAVNGQSSYYNSVECWAGVKYDHHAMSEKVWFSSTVTWSITITMDAIENDGGIHATIVPDISAPITDEGGNWLGKLEKVINKNSIVKQMESLANTMSHLINQADMTNQLNRAFAQQNTFIFPGGQQYFFKDLMFNNERDLLATVTIKFY